MTLVTRHTVEWGKETGDTEKLEYVITNLDPVTGYDIRVRSWTVDGAGNWTDPIYVETAVGGKDT